MEANQLMSFLNQEKFRAVIKAEENCEFIRVDFLPAEHFSQENRDRVAELWQDFIHQNLEIINISFRLANQEEKYFDFILENPDINNLSAARNGTMSLFLNKREAESLIRLSGQLDNSYAKKVAIYGFYPQKPENKNYTIFYAKDLVYCLIKK